MNARCPITPSVQRLELARLYDLYDMTTEYQELFCEELLCQPNVPPCPTSVSEKWALRNAASTSDIYHQLAHCQRQAWSLYRYHPDRVESKYDILQKFSAILIKTRQMVEQSFDRFLFLAVSWPNKVPLSHADSVAKRILGPLGTSFDDVLIKNKLISLDIPNAVSLNRHYPKVYSACIEFLSYELYDGVSLWSEARDLSNALKHGDRGAARFTSLGTPTLQIKLRNQLCEFRILLFLDLLLPKVRVFLNAICESQEKLHEEKSISTDS
jgi:hypothetical protein